MCKYKITNYTPPSPQTMSIVTRHQIFIIFDHFAFTPTHKTPHLFYNIWQLLYHHVIITVVCIRIVLAHVRWWLGQSACGVNLHISPLIHPFAHQSWFLGCVVRISQTSQSVFDGRQYEHPAARAHCGIDGGVERGFRVYDTCTIYGGMSGNPGQSSNNQPSCCVCIYINMRY